MSKIVLKSIQEVTDLGYFGQEKGAIAMVGCHTSRILPIIPFYLFKYRLQPHEPWCQTWTVF